MEMALYAAEPEASFSIVLFVGGWNATKWRHKKS